nr:hypothetical protein GCM10020092_105850 [Actinoplanes digitatis]
MPDCVIRAAPKPPRSHRRRWQDVGSAVSDGKGAHMDVGLKRELEAKVYAGERLTRADGVALYESDDLAWLGRLAHHKRTEMNADRVMFNVNRHLNLTNVCSASCAYCSFQRKPGEKDAYTMRIDEAVRKAKEMEDEQLTELHIVNGLHPTLPWRYYPKVLRELKAALPNVKLKCFTATEVQWFEKISGLPTTEILDELMDAGLESLTGGGAEIFDWEVRQHIVDHACHWEDWSRIHRLAHSKGMKTPATMLYGHIEEPRHRVDHVMRLRELQDETGGFAVFIPLRYQHDFVDSADGKIRNRIQARTTMASPSRVAAHLRGLPADVRQRAAPEELLGHARAVGGSALAELRRRRPGRLGRRVQDHPRRRRLRHADHDAPRRPAQHHLGRGFPARRAQHPLRGRPGVREADTARGAPQRAAAGLGVGSGRLGVPSRCYGRDQK